MTPAKVTSELSHWIDEPIDESTIAVHGGAAPDASTGAILTPIYTSTAFIQPSVEKYLSLGYSYSRQANPTVRSLEKRVAALENGFDAICVSSGMAATVTVFSAFLKAGDHCILTNVSYGGTNRAARVHFSKYNIEFSYVDLRDLVKVRGAIKENTRMLFSETPTNPILHLNDVRKLSDIVAEANKTRTADARIVHICDSTFATPIITKPLTLGADVVVQSLTKYYDGHNAAVGGAVVVSTKEQEELMSLHRNILGNMMAPHVAYHILTTTKTLPLRIHRQSTSAAQIAEVLSTHKMVESVTYPGLASFPQRELALRQHANGLHGGMICFEVKGGTEAGRKLMDCVKRPWALCENLGATESIITCPSVFTHANMREEDRKAVGITDGLIRLSVGLEDPKDLITSLKEALDSL